MPSSQFLCCVSLAAAADAGGRRRRRRRGWRSGHGWRRNGWHGRRRNGRRRHGRRRNVFDSPRAHRQDSLPLRLSRARQDRSRCHHELHGDSGRAVQQQSGPGCAVEHDREEHDRSAGRAGRGLEPGQQPELAGPGEQALARGRLYRSALLLVAVPVPGAATRRRGARPGSRAGAKGSREQGSGEEVRHQEVGRSRDHGARSSPRGSAKHQKKRARPSGRVLFFSKG